MPQAVGLTVVEILALVRSCSPSQHWLGHQAAGGAATTAEHGDMKKLLQLWRQYHSNISAVGSSARTYCFHGAYAHFTHTKNWFRQNPKFLSKHIWGRIFNQHFLYHHIIWDCSAFPFSSVYISISLSACWAYSHFLPVVDSAFCRGHKTLCSHSLYSLSSILSPSYLFIYFTVKKKNTSEEYWFCFFMYEK